jgi:hypothetical protein
MEIYTEWLSKQRMELLELEAKLDRNFGLIG